MQGSSQNEKRSAPRLNVPVYIRAFQEDFPLGTLVNLSSEGLFVQSTEPKETGTLIELRFQLPGDEAWIHLRAEVVWVSRPPSYATDEPFVPSSRPVTDNPGMGLRILSIAPESEPRLLAFLESPRGQA